MDYKKFVDTYLNIIKSKYICFAGTAAKEELISFIAVWLAGAIVCGIAAVILGLIKLGFIGAIICAVWNLGNLLPGLGTVVRFINSPKAQ